MYDEEVRTEIALIRQKTEFIEEKLTDLVERIDLSKLVKSSDFLAHTIQDRWMFGIIVTIMLGIFIKLFFN